MEDYAQTRLDQLSGGQKQKIAIAIALAMDPEIIVLDEPTANLDPQSTRDVFTILEKLHQEQGKTIILVEHKLEHLLEKTEHIVALDQSGAVLLCGDTCPVLAALVFDPQYGDQQLFLPQSLLLLRDLLQDPTAPREAEEFAEKARERLIVLSPTQLQAFIRQTWQELFAVFGLPQRQPTAKIAPPPPLLETKRLCFSFGKGKKTYPILRGVEMTIRQGDFCAIVGPNGAGKTTMLNLIFRALEGYQGSILLESRDILKMKKRDLYQRMGLVFQNPEWQFVANTVSQELEFSLRGKKLSKVEANKQIRQVMEQFGFSDPEQSPYLLSQGQKRRLSVAAMLLTGQRLLFLDEPTFGQDHANQQQLMQMMQELNSRGVTVVMVTHDMPLVADYASRVLLLLEGRIAYDGSPGELFANADLTKQAALICPEILELTRGLEGVLHYLSGRELTRAMRAVFVQGGLTDVSL
jgi:energy-coupling factor transport system ATP-binding protein